MASISIKRPFSMLPALTSQIIAASNDPVDQRRLAKVGLASNMRHKVIAGLQHRDGRQNSPAFFPTNFVRAQTGQVNRRPNQQHDVGPAALPPFGEKNLSPGSSSGSGLMHGCDSQGGSSGCQRIFTINGEAAAVSGGSSKTLPLRTAAATTRKA